jgi:hypothetical protein
VTGSRSSTYKRVVIRKLSKALVKGFVDPASYLTPQGIEVLDQQGRLAAIPLEEIKGVFFVRDFEGNPQRSERKVFRSRPRLAGLWVRMTFKDQEVLEGLVPNNLLDLDPLGFMVTPPDAYSNNLKAFIPRTALQGMEVLGVIADGMLRRGPRRTRKMEARETSSAEQVGLLFPAEQLPGK